VPFSLNLGRGSGRAGRPGNVNSSCCWSQITNVGRLIGLLREDYRTRNFVHYVIKRRQTAGASLAVFPSKKKKRGDNQSPATILCLLVPNMVQCYATISIGENNTCIPPTLEGWVYIVPTHGPLYTLAQYTPTPPPQSELPAQWCSRLDNKKANTPRSLNNRRSGVQD